MTGTPPPQPDVDGIVDDPGVFRTAPLPGASVPPVFQSLAQLH